MLQVPFSSLSSASKFFPGQSRDQVVPLGLFLPLPYLRWRESTQDCRWRCGVAQLRNREYLGWVFSSSWQQHQERGGNKFKAYREAQGKRGTITDHLLHPRGHLRTPPSFRLFVCLSLRPPLDSVLARIIWLRAGGGGGGGVGITYSRSKDW